MSLLVRVSRADDHFNKQRLLIPQIIAILPLIMFSFIAKAFTGASPSGLPPLHTRQIDLSGNLFSFSMPEDFSRDFPAEDMVERVNLDDPDLFSGQQSLTLIRRWWDIKGSGFFAKDQGTLMMSVYLKKIPTGTSWDIRDRFEFVRIIDANLKALHGAHNAEVLANGQPELEVMLPYINHNYTDLWVNQQRWVSYLTEQSRQISYLQSIPVSTQHYIEVDFTFMPNDGIDLYIFVKDINEYRATPIMNSFHVAYGEGNPIKGLVEDNTVQPLREYIDGRIEALESSSQEP